MSAGKDVMVIFVLIMAAFMVAAIPGSSIQTDGGPEEEWTEIDGGLSFMIDGDETLHIKKTSEPGVMPDYKDCGPWCESVFVHVAIEDGVQNIGARAFVAMNSILDVKIISDDLTAIGNFAFLRCEGMVSIELPPSMESIGSSAFEGCGSLEAAIIPEGVTIVNDNCFKNCTSLEEVVIGSTVEKINDRAFEGCSKLKNVGFSDSIVFIGQRAFHDCTGLETIELPKELAWIDSQAFAGCTALRSITFNPSIFIMKAGAFEDHTFYDKKGKIMSTDNATEFENRIFIGEDIGHMIDNTPSGDGEGDPAVLMYSAIAIIALVGAGLIAVELKRKL